MPCDPAPRRAPLGWLLLLACVVLAGFYLHVLRTIRAPHVSEGFRRIYMTGEFKAYPDSLIFEGRNGLAYDLGKTVTLDGEKPRLYLSRYDWRGGDHEGPFMRGPMARLFLHLDPAEKAAEAPMTLTLTFDCRMPAGAPAIIAVSANATGLGSLECAAQGMVTQEFAIPKGTLGRAYDEIRLERQGVDRVERLKTWLGLRLEAIALRAFRIAR